MSEEPVRTMLARLSAERDEAHRRYNHALTELDRAIQSIPRWADPPPPFEPQELARLGDSGRIVPDGDPDLPGGWRGRLAGFVWRCVGPALQRQRGFNASLVDHLGDHARAHADARAALAQTLDALRGGFDDLIRFESLLVQFLQQITPVADTKERATLGELRPVHEGLNGLREGLNELRADLRAVHSTLDELRAVSEIEQRASAMARREIERLAGTSRPTDASAPQAGRHEEPVALDSYKYVAFEDCFRGPEEEIRARVADYLPYFEGASNVLDLGCGRGELLDLLKTHGVPARGLDVNPEMVEVCRARGLDAEVGDALGHLRTVPDESLGGLTAIQVVEHLEPDYLARLLQTAFYKLRPGAPLVVETINPACWVAFFESYIRDLTHVRPVHPETLRHLLQASGFGTVDIVYRVPIAEDGRLQRVTPRPHPHDEPMDPLTELVTAFNRNVDALNDRIFTFQDYAAIARRA